MKCRYCQSNLTLEFVDLDQSPPSNAYIASEEHIQNERNYPLRVLCCEECWLVQTEDFTSADELFDAEYAYFSSFSSSWLTHCENYAHEVSQRFSLDASSCVVEIAANDGYLLQYFQSLGIPNYGIEPTHSTATAARDKGIEIVEEFFGVNLAKQLVKSNRQADLMIANNVLAHVPNINDFVKGFSQLLKPHGIATFEFPHLCQLVANNQFDTIYHEHFSYLSLTFVMRLFESCGLQIFDVEELPTHGGSLRVYAQQLTTGVYKIEQRVLDLTGKEATFGVTNKEYYQGFQAKADKVSQDLNRFIEKARSEGKSVAAYGAAAKGNTLLNYSKLNNQHIDFVVDLNPQKQGKYLPGSHIPIVDEKYLKDHKPDFIIIFPWNLLNEIKQQLSYVSSWGAEFVVALPELKRIQSS